MNVRQTIGRTAGGVLLLVALTLGAAVAMSSAQDRGVPTTGTADQKPVQVPPEDEAPANQSGDTAPDDASELRVGTYNPQLTFSQYHGMEAYNEFLSGLEQEAQQAQQTGNQQKLIELQQRVQARQDEIVQAFEDELDAALPSVAKEAGVRLIVVDVAFKDDNISETDLTQRIVERVNANAAQGGENGDGDNGDAENADDDTPAPQDQQ